METHSIVLCHIMSSIAGRRSCIMAMNWDVKNLALSNKGVQKILFNEMTCKVK